LQQTLQYAILSLLRCPSHTLATASPVRQSLVRPFACPLSRQFYHTPHAAAIQRHPYGDVDLFNKTVGGKVKKHPEKLLYNNALRVLDLSSPWGSGMPARSSHRLAGEKGSGEAALHKCHEVFPAGRPCQEKKGTDAHSRARLLRADGSPPLAFLLSCRSVVGAVTASARRSLP